MIEMITIFFGVIVAMIALCFVCKSLCRRKIADNFEPDSFDQVELQRQQDLSEIQPPALPRRASSQAYAQRLPMQSPQLERPSGRDIQIDLDIPPNEARFQQRMQPNWNNVRPISSRGSIGIQPQDLPDGNEFI